MIIEPTLIVDSQKCHKNIDKILSNLEGTNATLRPHFKTHQSAEIGQIFKERGIDKITVSSFAMAEFFVRNGWRDITVAFPANILEIDKINYLSSSVELNILVESLETADVLAEKCHNDLNYYIKIDVGTNRTGVLPGNVSLIDSIIERCSHNAHLKFSGFLAHAGHSYQARSRKEIEKVFDETVAPLKKLKEKYQIDFPYVRISYGDTPTASVGCNFEGIDEIRCGNFIYYDIMQAQIGSCSYDEISVAMACPVVAKHADRNEIVLYGGGVHFSKDFIDHSEYGLIYGLMVENKNDLWGSVISGAFLRKLSQEHGILKVEKDQFGKISIGDIVKILPVHSCMAANLMKHNTLII